MMTKVKQFTSKNAFVWPLLGCILLWLAIGAVSGKFGVNTISSCAKLCTFALLLGLGQMLVVTSGNGSIDLSQRYILTLCAYISCNLMASNLGLGLIGTVAVGALCGLTSALINVYLKVPAMITTLATGYIFYTIILLASPHMTSLPESRFAKFVNINLGPLNMMTLVCLVVAVLLGVLLYRTRYGRQLHAVGQNRVAAAYSGINVNRTIIIAFVLNGALCGLAGAMCGAFNGGAFQDMGTTYFLPSIAATFVGGTIAGGGKSNVAGVCVGALMMSFMTTFLNAAKISAGAQRLIQGIFLVLLLVAAVSDAKKKK